MSWIVKLLETTRESESPKKYWYWAGLSAISAVVNNKVYLNKFYYKLYPNIYVLLVGKSGIRKGPPVAMARSLVEAVDNTRVITGRASIQAVISELRNSSTKPNGGPPIPDAIGFLHSSEFAAFLIQDPAALTVLTDLYDGHYNPTWTNLTKIGGKENLKNPCITLLGASNEVHFKDAVPDNALGGGFVARTFIIHAEKKSGSNPLTQEPETIPSVEDLSRYLLKLSKLKGEFVWSPEGKELYEKWYERFDKSENTDTTGTMDRLHDHVLKAAMLISLSREPDLRLEVTDIREAIMACQDFVPGARKLTMTSGGKSASAIGVAVILRELLSRKDDNYGMWRIAMGQKHWQYFDMFELDKIIESLKMQRSVREEFVFVNPETGKPDPRGTEKQLWYYLEPRVVENYEKKVEGAGKNGNG